MRSRELKEGSQINEQELFDILSHTTRRMILRELNKQLYLSYSELQILIPQSPGVIYHHLEKLQEKGLIQQRKGKEYELAPLGVQAVSYLEKLDDDDLSSIIISQSPFHDIFLIIPLSRLILKNP
ncbi:MAG: ArsR/SmtB family transcription factor, partial [Candidatus Hodarchaeota archaeon]